MKYISILLLILSSFIFSCTEKKVKIIKEIHVIDTIQVQQEDPIQQHIERCEKVEKKLDKIKKKLDKRKRN